MAAIMRPARGMAPTLTMLAVIICKPMNRPRIDTGTTSPNKEPPAGMDTLPANTDSAVSAIKATMALVPLSTKGIKAISKMAARPRPPAPSNTQRLRTPLLATSQAPRSGATNDRPLLIEARVPTMDDVAPRATRNKTSKSA